MERTLSGCPSRNNNSKAKSTFSIPDAAFIPPQFPQPTRPPPDTMRGKGNFTQPQSRPPSQQRVESYPWEWRGWRRRIRDHISKFAFASVASRALQAILNLIRCMDSKTPLFTARQPLRARNGRSNQLGSRSGVRNNRSNPFQASFTAPQPLGARSSRSSPLRASSRTRRSFKRTEKTQQI